MSDQQPAPLVDVHAHFHTPWSGRADWQRYNQSRLDAGERIGITVHVASVLGSWGHTSPTYFPSPLDLSRGNDWMFDFAATSSNVRAYVAVNPNHTQHALHEIERGRAAGAVGIKLAASRRADDALVDDIARLAVDLDLPILHHVWQHRRRDWPGQDASDALDIARLARRHPRLRILLAHIGGGGDWAHTPPAIRDTPNVYVDLSGSGIDRGMMDLLVATIGVPRVLWAADLTLCTGLTKLRALAHLGVSDTDIAAMRWRNALDLFPPGAFDAWPALARATPTGGARG